MKVPKTVPITFQAHRCIVENCSSIIAVLCEAHGDGTTPIQITGVAPDVFHLLLSYIYGMKISNEDMESHAKDIIDAADRYGVISRKLEAEAFSVEATTLTVKNVKELLLYADSKNLALLKEAAIDFIVDDMSDVIEKLTTNDLIPGSLIKDVLVTVLCREKVNIKSQLAYMRVSELRKKAQEMGQGVDGSREMLITALKESGNAHHCSLSESLSNVVVIVRVSRNFD
jgi:hypothetical protein